MKVSVYPPTDRQRNPKSCLAKMAYKRQSRPYSGLGFQVKVFETVYPCSLASSPRPQLWNRSSPRTQTSRSTSSSRSSPEPQAPKPRTPNRRGTRGGGAPKGLLRASSLSARTSAARSLYLSLSHTHSLSFYLYISLSLHVHLSLACSLFLALSPLPHFVLVPLSGFVSLSVFLCLSLDFGRSSNNGCSYPHSS